MANSLHIDSTPNAFIFLHKLHHHFGLRSSSAWAKKAAALPQDSIAAFEFVNFAFECLDAGVLRLLGYDSGFFAS